MCHPVSHSLVLTVGNGMGVVGNGEYRVFGEVWFVVPAAATYGVCVDIEEARNVLYCVFGDVMPAAVV